MYLLCVGQEYAYCVVLHLGVQKLYFRVNKNSGGQDVERCCVS